MNARNFLLNAIVIATATILGFVVLTTAVAALPASVGAPTQTSSSLDALQPATSSTAALNWAGYVAKGEGYTFASGTWIVPSVTIPTGTGADATWVGIGGVASRDLIQAGTEAVPDDAGGIVYQAWFEMLPETSQPVPLAIKPGDSITASITESGANVWLISIRNNTTGESWSDQVKYDSSRSSAEWIEELPVVLGGRVGLDDFGTLKFTNGYAIHNGVPQTIGQTGARPLLMTNAEGASIATPSVLADGSAFTVTRSDAQATPLALGRYGLHPVVSDAAQSDGQGQYRIVSLGGGHHHGGGWQIIVSF